MDYEKKDFRKLYEDLVKSDWFKRAYHNKSLGEYPFDIPELAESEDEKTRKELLEEIESIIPHEDETDGEGLILPSYHTRIDRYKSYLEKQKEYELTEEDKKIIPEALVMLCDDIINHRVHTPIKTDEEGARKIKAFLKTFNRQPHKTMKEWEKQKEQKPAEWSEEDERKLQECIKIVERWEEDYDIAYAPYSNTLKSLRPQPKQVWTEEDDRICHLIMANLSESARHAITLPMETVNDFNNWLRTLQCMPPVFTDWNEEDQTLLSDALGCVTMVQELKKRGKLKNFHISCSYDELRSWVRSLKSRPRKQPSWKPSEDQMDALKFTLEYMPDTFKPRCTLMTLQNDLEKLM